MLLTSHVKLPMYKTSLILMDLSTLTQKTCSQQKQSYPILSLSVNNVSSIFMYIFSQTVGICIDQDRQTLLKYELAVVSFTRFFLYDMTSSVHLFALIYVLNINTNYTSQIHKPHIKNPKQPPFLKNLFLFLISYGRCSVVFKLSHCAFCLYLVYFEISILYESVKIYDMSWYSFFS